MEEGTGAYIGRNQGVRRKRKVELWSKSMRGVGRGSVDSKDVENAEYLSENIR